MKSSSSHRDFYVYVYINPETGHPFYVGKGKGKRARAHLGDIQAPEREKEETIARLRESGLEPKIEIVQWNLSEAAALAAESALIQFIGLDQLANLQRGRGNRKVHADFIEFISEKKPLRVSQQMGEEMLILCANKCYRDGMSRFELYDAVRGNLNVDEDRVKHCRFVLVALEGFVLDVYKDPVCIIAGREPRAFAQHDSIGSFDLVAEFCSPLWRNRFVGRKLNVRFAFNSFTYAPIRIPRGRY